MHKPVKDLEPGDKVKMEDGQFWTVRTAHPRGFWPGSRLIDWTNGEWSCLDKKTMATLAA